uniref:hypothetical protein n=1 Tax=Enterocloster hominis (ex Hitch et al. 2024) TaxID=1917870 RepID=UPI001031C7CD|nr:hypothetical protein [Lachnoclostridium pacaense]
MKYRLNIIVETLTRRLQGVVIDYTTPQRVRKLESYKYHREIALALCTEGFLKRNEDFYVLEYIYDNIHILLTAEYQNATLRINLYDCYREVCPYENIEKNIALYSRIKYKAYEDYGAYDLMKTPPSFAITCSIDDKNYAFFDTETSTDINAVIADVYNSSDIETEINYLYEDCINSGVAGIDYVIDIKDFVV